VSTTASSVRRAAVPTVGLSQRHVPAEHVLPPVQALPQLPQLAAFVCKSKQVLVHSVCPATGQAQLP
jgi:hypothetical protein